MRHIGLSACDMSRARVPQRYIVCVSRLAVFLAVFAFLALEMWRHFSSDTSHQCLQFDNATLTRAVHLCHSRSFLPMTRTNPSFKTHCLYWIAMGIDDRPQGVGAIPRPRHSGGFTSSRFGAVCRHQGLYVRPVCCRRSVRSYLGCSGLREASFQRLDQQDERTWC